MHRLILLFYFLIFIPIRYTPYVDLVKYYDCPPAQIKEEKAKKWFLFKERKRYFHRRYA